MHSVSAIYTMPTILNTLKPIASSTFKQPGKLKANTAGTTGTGSSTSSTSSAGGLGTTFLNLLSQELKNQDPTAPVDSTAMVGQMISLNQLDQLISINHRLVNYADWGSATSSDREQHRAIIRDRRGRQRSLSFNCRRSSQPTAVRSQYHDAPELQ